MLRTGLIASLRARLMVLSLAALAPGFAVTGYLAWDVTRLRQAEVADLALRSAWQAAYELDRILSGIEALLIGVAVAPVREGPACEAYLAAVRARLPSLAALGWVAADGSVPCGAGLVPGPVAGGEAAPAGGPAATSLLIGQYLPPAAAGAPALLPVALAMPGDGDGDGRRLVALIDLGWLGMQLQARSLPPGGSLTVADRAGVILARQPQPERFVGTRIPDAFLGLVTAQAAGTETVVSQDGTVRVLGYVPVGGPPHGLYVSTGLSAQASYAAVARAIRIGALLALLGGAATLAGTWLVGSRAFVRPLLALKSILERWRAGERGVRTGAAGDGEIASVAIALDRMMDDIGRSEEHRSLLARELAHRVANTLTIVQSMALATMNKPAPARDVLPAFLARLSSLSRTHQVLVQESWDSADLRSLVLQVVQPLADDVERRFTLDGPPVRLLPRHALAMTMVLHELCTNALKYGALKYGALQPGAGGQAGRVALCWSVATTPAGPELRLDWRESGGPEVITGGPAGFGTRLVGRAFAGLGEVSLDLDPAGVACHIRLRLEEVAVAA